MARLILVCVALAAVGCQPKDRDDIAAQGQKAFDSAKSAANVAMGSLSREAEKLTSHSPAEAIAAVRAKVVDLQKQLELAQEPSALDRLHLDTVKAQIARLDAALRSAELRRRWDDALEKAKEGGQWLGTSIEQARSRLRDRDPSFRELDDKLNEAERGFVNASNRLKEAVDREDAAAKGTTGG